MMKKNRLRLIPIGLSAAFTLFCLIYGLLSNDYSERTYLITVSGIAVILIAVIAVEIVSLVRSMKRTIYSYDNVELTAVIIFASVLLLIMLSYLMYCFISKDGFSPKYVFSSIMNFPENFSLYALIPIGILSLLVCISNVSLIRHEGFRTKNLLGIVLGGLYIGATLVLYIIKKVLLPSPEQTGKALRLLLTFFPMFCLIMLSYFECIFFAFCIMSLKAVRHIPSHDKDFIIIPGCSIDKKGGLLPLLKGRTNRAIRFAWDQEIETGKKVLYIPSGGQGKDEIMSEGSAMGLYLMAKGAEEDEVFPEKQSTDTYENMLFSKKIIDSINPEASVAFATTNFHIFRSGMFAVKAGLNNPEGISAKTKWYFWPNGFIREFFGLLSINVRAHIDTAVVFSLISFLLSLISVFGNIQ